MSQDVLSEDALADSPSSFRQLPEALLPASCGSNEEKDFWCKGGQEEDQEERQQRSKPGRGLKHMPPVVHAACKGPNDATIRNRERF